MGGHAVVSPSAAERWMECPGSIKLGKLFPDSTSDYADEGTLAHELCRILVMREAKQLNNYTYNKAFEEIKLSKYYCEEMQDFCEGFMRFVLEEFYESGEGAVLKVETRVNLDSWVPEGFGTVDIQIAADRFLKIIDFKYGKGIYVEAEKNPQLMLYGLGVLEENDLLYDIEFVKIIIYQPRLENIGDYTIHADALREWGDKVLKPKAKAAYEGSTEFKAGKWCQFCKAKPNCKVLAEYNLEVAKEQFRIGDSDEELELLSLKETHLLNDKQIAAIVLRRLEFHNWIKSVVEHALSEAVTNQKKYPGLKLVSGMSKRQIGDKDKVIEDLVKLKYEKSKITKTELLGITALTKIIKAKDFTAVLTSRIFKPAGAPTLVQASDKRPELNSHDEAVKQFKSEKFEDDNE